MLEMTIQVPEPLAEELTAHRERMPEVLAYGLRQLSPLPNEIYQYILQFLISSPSAEEIVAFSPTPAMLERVSVLMDKNRQGSLTPLEERELDEYVRINHFVTMIKARTLPFLSSSKNN
jgi:hypothetical protein